jgi:hypothetical protein
MDEITRREKLLAKVCWPEIDTQRTKFHQVDCNATSYALPVYTAAPLVYHREGVPVASTLTMGIEHVRLDKWAYRGKRHNVVARWGYSSLLDIVVIRDVRVEHHTAQAVAPVLRRMFGDTP